MTAEETDPAGALPGHCFRHSCQRAQAVGLSCVLISTSDVGLTAFHSPGHSSSYPEQSSGAAIPWEMGLSGALCWNLTVATGEEAQTCKADLPSDANCSVLQVVFLSAECRFKCYREIRKV